MLGTADAADKKARKPTLCFHTSKIESASARRQDARLALGAMTTYHTASAEKRKRHVYSVRHQLESVARAATISATSNQSRYEVRLAEQV